MTAGRAARASSRLSARTIALVLLRVILVLGTLVLTGCAAPASARVTPRAGGAELYAILDRTETELGGTWQNQDDPTPAGCVYPLWTKGSHYPALRLGSAPDDGMAAIARTGVLWSKLGYSLQTTRVGGVVQLTGTRSLDRLLLLRVGPHSMTLQGESECRPD